MRVCFFYLKFILVAVFDIRTDIQYTHAICPIEWGEISTKQSVGKCKQINFWNICVRTDINSFPLFLLGSQEEWQGVFFICATVYIASFILYAVFVSGEEQDWAKEKGGAKDENSENYIPLKQLEKQITM